MSMLRAFLSVSSRSASNASRPRGGPRSRKVTTAALCLVPVGFTAWLGFWQWGRAQEKQQILDERIAALKWSRSQPTSRKELEQMLHQRVSVTGRFLHDKEFHVGPRPRNDMPGFTLVVPFRLQNGDVILVCRGWVPAQLKDRAKRKESLIEGNVAIEGVVRSPEKPNRYTPEHDIRTNIWYFIDPETMGQQCGAESPPIVEVVDVAGSKDSIPYPQLGYDQYISIPMPPQKHREYAYTWWSLSGVLSVASGFLVKGLKAKR